MLGVAVLLGSPVAGRASADDTPSSWEITSYVVEATLDAAGTAAVRIDLAFDFSDDPGHGPYVTLPLRQRIAHHRQMS
mgnify:FL=1